MEKHRSVKMCKLMFSGVKAQAGLLIIHSQLTIANYPLSTSSYSRTNTGDESQVADRWSLLS